MNKMKSLVLMGGSFALLSLGTASPLLAQTATVTAATPAASSSPWEAGAKIQSESTRDKQNEFNGVDMEIQPSVTYKFTSQDALSLTPIARIVDKTAQERESSLETLELKFKRKKILTNDAHGVDLAAEIRSAYHPDTTYREKKNVYGYNQFRISPKKVFNETFSLEGILRFDFYNGRTGNFNKTKTASRIYLIPEYRFSDSFTVTSQMLYTHKEQAVKGLDRTLDEDNLEVAPSLNYFMNKNVAFSLYMEFIPFKGHDQETVAPKFVDSSVLGFLVNASI